MTAAPSLLQIVKALLSALALGLLGEFRRVPSAARVALLPILVVPFAVIASLSIAHVSQPLPPVVKPLALPSAEPSLGVAGYEVEDFARLLQTIFGLDSERALIFSDWILEASVRQQLPPEIIASLVYTESSFRKQVRSWAGAIGPAQVKPQFWRDFCGGVDLLDPEHNIYCGAQVLAHYKAQCGELECALRLYNVGPGNLRLPRYQQAGNRYLARIESSRVLFDEHTLL